LRWVIEEIVRSNCPILFDLDMFDAFNIPHSLVQHEPSSTSEERAATSGDRTRERDDQDERDARQVITDEIWKVRWWWLLEAIPVPYISQNAIGEWLTTWW
jgi:hypothetical protein